MGDESVLDLDAVRLPRLGEPPGPQARVQRHTVEQMIESFVPVPMLDLDALVLQTVDQLVAVLQNLGMSRPVEQVIDVPKIVSQDFIPQRAVLRVAQLVEQLVDVPLPSLRLVRSVDAGGEVLGSGQRRCWLHVVPILWTTWGPLVAVGHTTCPVGTTGGDHRQPRAVLKFLASSPGPQM